MVDYDPVIIYTYIESLCQYISRYWASGNTEKVEKAVEF